MPGTNQRTFIQNATAGGRTITGFPSNPDLTAHMNPHESKPLENFPQEFVTAYQAWKDNTVDKLPAGMQRFARQIGGLFDKKIFTTTKG